MITLLIDSNYLCWRAHYTTGDLSIKEQKTGVIFTFLNQVLKLSKMFDTNQFIFCWDSKKSYRKIIYPPYKYNREKKKKELTEEEKRDLQKAYKQFDMLRTEILSELGFSNVLHYPGFEADDIIAKLTKEIVFGNKLIITSDNDMFQLLNMYTTIYELKEKKKITLDDFCNKYNIGPALWSTAKAIGGCNSDEVIGIKGAADPKSETSKALSFIRGELNDGKIKERITSDEGKEIIKRNMSLVDLPFCDGWELPDIKLSTDNFKKKNFVEVFDRFDFRTFLKRIGEWGLFYGNNT